PKSRPFSGGLRRKEWVEHPLFDLRRDAGPVVANSDFDPIAQIFGDCGRSGLVVAAILFRLTLRRGVEAVRNKVEKNARDLLREQINLAGSRIKGLFESDVEALFFSARTVVGEI